jgi:hypothetical protein
MRGSTRSGLDKRALVFFLLTISFIMMIVSGILLDGIEFENKMVQGIVSKVFHKAGVSIFFVIALFHIYYNWKLFLRYFRHFKYLKELVISVAFVAIVLVASSAYTYYH